MERPFQLSAVRAEGLNDVRCTGNSAHPKHRFMCTACREDVVKGRRVAPTVLQDHLAPCTGSCRAWASGDKVRNRWPPVRSRWRNRNRNRKVYCTVIVIAEAPAPAEDAAAATASAAEGDRLRAKLQQQEQAAASATAAAVAAEEEARRKEADESSARLVAQQAREAERKALQEQ